MTSWEWRGWPVWWVRTRGILSLLAIYYGVLQAAPRPLWSWPGSLILCCEVVALGCWLAFYLSPSERWASRLAPQLGGVAGLVLSFLVPHSPAFAICAMGCLNAGAYRSVRWSAGYTSALSIAYVGGQLLLGTGPGWIVAGPAAFSTGLLAGLVRRQNYKLLAQTEAAREEHARAAALAERARIAREIHDVLAHSLAALTVQLETADALLEGGRVAQAQNSVLRAGQLAREGLAETRRAITALRGDTPPLPDLLAELAEEYRADLQAPAVVEIAGVPVDLGPDRVLGLYRTAQEAMTNIRKHAPGAPVRVTLRYEPERVTLRIRNGSPSQGVSRPLAGVGGGYGLTGLRERAELSGGEFAAGPEGTGWQVDVTMPT